MHYDRFIQIFQEYVKTLYAFMVIHLMYLDKKIDGKELHCGARVNINKSSKILCKACVMQGRCST